MRPLVKDLVAIIAYNDIRLVDENGDEICLIRNGFVAGILSDEYLDLEVAFIKNDEAILNTINIYV